VILGHTVLLSLLALVPFWCGMGWIYLASAAAGGTYFTWRSIELVRRPCPPVAMRNFGASLVQLTLLLAGAIADSLLLGARVSSADAPPCLDVARAPAPGTPR
jgi:protoheme IX farnesyltransferase